MDIEPHGTRAGRTPNMPYMFVTLDVSKLSGWLNADASCRVETKAYEAGRGAGKRGREVRRATATQLKCAGGKWTLSAWHARGAHRKHVAHVYDAGRVEAQRLIERRRFLPSRNGRYEAGELQAKGRERGVG